jgi:nucleotidyltransferase substrate binding protein (TIGR01987 family)
MTLVLGKINIASLQKAYAQLDNAVKVAKSELERAGAIQCFEYSYELAWKTLRKILILQGKQVFNTPRDVFREAAASGLITNPEQWFDFLDYRNQTVHTYDEQTAQEIFDMLPTFRDEIKKLIKHLESLA